MSYDIDIKRADGSIVELSEKHVLKGGTYPIGGDRYASLNITYNYSRYFYAVMGAKGIRTIYDMPVVEGLVVLNRAAAVLSAYPDAFVVAEDYWKPTVSNALRAIRDLITLGELVLTEGNTNVVWYGD